MAAVNDRITRFVRDSELPVIMFGFGDCTGGAQASFVTHPLAQTYYFSGTNMPFAGQIVVQSNLPSTSTLSNYLSVVPGAMQGLVRHPFFDDLDDRLRKIDPEIPLPTETVVEVVHRVMARLVVDGAAAARRAAAEIPRPRSGPADVERVLIHARGCTAVKLIRVAQRNGIEVVLVQSDPDMDSASVDMLTERDRVVCIGGNTPDESYLNAMSVLRVAEHEARRLAASRHRLPVGELAASPSCAAATASTSSDRRSRAWKRWATSRTRSTPRCGSTCRLYREATGF